MQTYYKLLPPLCTGEVLIQTRHRHKWTDYFIGATDQALGLDGAIFDASIDHSLLQAGRVDYLDVAAYVPALSERAVSLLPADCVRELALHEVNIVCTGGSARFYAFKALRTLPLLDASRCQFLKLGPVQHLQKPAFLPLDSDFYVARDVYRPQFIAYSAPFIA
ncbi:hypothetical protein LVJ82_08330 [Vitreoscilla massiliensis]|uniref:Uncharacterized protein n=1 Tax=Vitreoscilla massiliensis TaxID=1689272 RepID=A0ABY4E5B0_9NEIS|nr:hypothetical protein [Vitreoscilla massiliensis]UOO90954.1 hypothetical protein LVJ82_08330 [Vitreoscilla massiliensis]